MPIEPGDPWGEVVDYKEDVPCFNCESSLERLLGATILDGRSSVALVDGDFVRVTGGPHRDRLTMRRYSCDVLHYRADGSNRSTGSTIGTIEVAAYLGRLRWGYAAITNLGMLQGVVVSSRSHPNDGKFEVVDALVGLPFKEYLGFRRRCRAGLPVEHSSVRMGSTTRFEFSHSKLKFRVDGSRWSSCRHVGITIQPDALMVCVAAIHGRHRSNS